MTTLARDPGSHKGDNGRVAIIGGSTYQHGAPLFAALAAEASGVDLLFVCLPMSHAGVAKVTSLNFQVHPFSGNELTVRDLPGILELLATIDTAVVGPGLGRSTEGLKVLRELVDSAPCTLILDASALQSWTLDAMKGKKAIMTPHLGELERMGLTMDAALEAAQQFSATILCKGPVDTIISSEGKVRAVAGGNAGLTVGGMGDALAGLTAGLVAQHVRHHDAAAIASTVIKRVGENLYTEKGNAYTARDVIWRIPEVLAKM